MKWSLFGDVNDNEYILSPLQPNAKLKNVQSCTYEILTYQRANCILLPTTLSLSLSVPPSNSLSLSLSLSLLLYLILLYWIVWFWPLSTPYLYGSLRFSFRTSWNLHALINDLSSPIWHERTDHDKPCSCLWDRVTIEITLDSQGWWQGGTQRKMVREREREREREWARKRAIEGGM